MPHPSGAPLFVLLAVYNSISLCDTRSLLPANVTDEAPVEVVLAIIISFLDQLQPIADTIALLTVAEREINRII